METPFYQRHDLDAEGRPDGGVTWGDGFTITWQKGPLGRGENRAIPNGAFVENIINAAIGRIEFYQAGQFACDENAEALQHLIDARDALRSRTANREARGVEGTHER